MLRPELINPGRLGSCSICFAAPIALDARAPAIGPNLVLRASTPREARALTPRDARSDTFEATLEAAREARLEAPEATPEATPEAREPSFDAMSPKKPPPRVVRFLCLVLTPALKPEPPAVLRAGVTISFALELRLCVMMLIVVVCLNEVALCLKI